MWFVCRKLNKNQKDYLTKFIVIHLQFFPQVMFSLDMILF